MLAQKASRPLDSADITNAANIAGIRNEFIVSRYTLAITVNAIAAYIAPNSRRFSSNLWREHTTYKKCPKSIIAIPAENSIYERTEKSSLMCSIRANFKTVAVTITAEAAK